MNQSRTNQQWDADAWVARFEQLERQNERLSRQIKRLKAVVTFFLCVVCLGLLWAWLPTEQANAQAKRAPNIIRANGIIIVDKGGVERGSFSYNDADQNVVLSLESSKETRINLNSGRDSVGLRISHAKNDINLGCSPKGGTYLEMFDKDGTSIFEQRKP
jgi:hypothetical protein